MNKNVLGVAFVLTALAGLSGCAGDKPENPVDYFTFNDQPLVRDVVDDMTKKEVLQVGGQPSSVINRSVEPGTCNNYILNNDDHQQPYYVSFNSADRVDSKGFMTCQQMEENARARARVLGY
ncbi:osmotically-inducible lipoprotein OsmE [Pseudomonas segetis]